MKTENKQFPKIGEVWRKHGPCGWMKVEGVQLPGHPEYDGGLPGVSVKITNINGNYKRTTYFYPFRDYAEFKEGMIKNFRFLQKLR